MYFESHAHYDDKRFDDDRYETIERVYANGVDYIVNSGSDMNSSEFGIELSHKYPFFYAAVGIHPHETKDIKQEDMLKLLAMSKDEKVVAIGEIGLDYYYDLSPRDIQRKWFEKQLDLSIEAKLPVIIHSRDAAGECFDIIKNSGVRKGVIHSYSGSVEMALDYIEMGFYIGVGGIVTFKNAKKTANVVKSIPISKILIETDSPYLTPEPNRGVRNDSQNLKYIVEKIAQIKQIEPEKVAEITMVNAKELFFEK
jgi:TatD DNase family protein